jgi:hypothetical protein
MTAKATRNLFMPGFLDQGGWAGACAANVMVCLFAAGRHERDYPSRFAKKLNDSSPG